MYRVTQAGKQPRELTELGDVLWIGESMLRDNPYDEVLFEEKRHGKYEPCGRLKPLAAKPKPPRGRIIVWQGWVFSAYYAIDDKGTTRPATALEAMWAEAKTSQQVSR